MLPLPPSGRPELETPCLTLTGQPTSPTARVRPSASPQTHEQPQRLVPLAVWDGMSGDGPGGAAFEYHGVSRNDSSIVGFSAARPLR